MSYPELLDAIRKLPQTDKIRLMHDLVDDVASSSELALLKSLGVSSTARYEVWFPNGDGAAAAAALQALLEQRGEV
jgi:hypothetical protein